MTWEIVVGLIALMGALVTICGVVVKVNGTLVRLEDAIDRLNSFMETQTVRNTKIDKDFLEHERRISKLEMYHRERGDKN